MIQDSKDTLNTIAARYNLQIGTVESLLQAVIRGNGTMAQFNVGELGGNGQWMRGGMTMVGDMFNNSLRNTVDLLCLELSDLYLSGQIPVEKEGLKSAKEDSLNTGYYKSGNWPEEFGPVTTGGSQNEMRYAYFAGSERLIIENDGKRTVYDTGGRSITGVSQQQSNSLGTLLFTGPGGNIRLEDLKPVPEAGTGDAHVLPAEPDKSGEANELSGVSPRVAANDDIISTIERLYDLSKKGIISADEFETKRKELLMRL